MSEEEVRECPVAVDEEAASKAKNKLNRNIIRFNGEKPAALNFEHVTNMYLDGNKITFEFYTKALPVEFADAAIAASTFDTLVTLWAENAV